MVIMVANTTASKKAKGRNFQKKIAKDIIDNFKKLTENDVFPRSMGSGGIDIQLSEQARAVFPFAVEAKNQETTSIWSWIEQCEYNAEKENLIPLLIFKRNHSKAYAVIDWDLFLKMIKK